MVTLVLYEANDGWPRQPDRAPYFFQFRRSFQTVGQSWRALTRPPAARIDPEEFDSRRTYRYPWGAAAPTTTAGQSWLLWGSRRPQDPPDDPRPASVDLGLLHRYRPGYQTVGQPFLAFPRQPPPTVLAEEFEPHRQDPGALFRFRTGYQTVGQPMWLQGWRSTVPDTSDPAWPHYDLTGLMRLYRPAYQTVGQPVWMQGWKSKVPDIPDETWPHYDPNKYFWQFQTMLPTFGTTALSGPDQLVFYEANDGFPRQPDRNLQNSIFFNRVTTTPQPNQPAWSLYWKSSVPDTTDTAWPHYDPNMAWWTFNFQNPPPSGATIVRGPSALVLYEENSGFPRNPDSTGLSIFFNRTQTGTVVIQPWWVFQNNQRSQAQDQDFTSKSDNQGLFRFRTGYQTVGQPLWMLQWKSNVPDTTDYAWPKYDRNVLALEFWRTHLMTIWEAIFQVVNDQMMVYPVEWVPNATIPWSYVTYRSPFPDQAQASWTYIHMYASFGPPGVRTTTTVPSIVGLSWFYAYAALAKASLDPQSYTYAYSNTVPAGSVISQAVVAGSIVNNDQTVSYVISNGPAPVTNAVVVPNVVGMKISQAQAAIMAANLMTAPPIYQHSGSAIDTVIVQSPTAGTPVTIWTRITLTVSQG